MINAKPSSSFFSPPPERSRCVPNLVEELELATRNIQKQLGGVNDFTQEMFFLGDGVQRAAMDRFFDFLQPGKWNPARLMRVSSTAISETLQITRFFTPGWTSYLSWLEIQNKLEVFLLVRNLPSILGLSPDKPRPLPQLVHKAYELSAFAALWAVEGLGHYYADICWKENDPPRALLTELQTSVPDQSLLMLHAGMGLSFAYRLLGHLVRGSSASQVRETVNRFVALCRENSCDGYMGAAIEALGLVTRDFYPEMVRSISHSLLDIDAELAGFFWHGAGRALYFSRSYFLPLLGTPWRAIDSEGATGMERTNLMAGLAWAVTLVNMRHPHIIEGVLSYYVQQSSLKDAFANGVSSSIIVREDTTPGASFVKSFCAHQSNCVVTGSFNLWRTLVAVPCEQACRTYPKIKKNRSLDQVFRFRSKARLT
jgi:hypothetical protein